MATPATKSWTLKQMATSMTVITVSIMMFFVATGSKSKNEPKKCRRRKKKRMVDFHWPEKVLAHPNKEEPMLKVNITPGQTNMSTDLK